MSLYSGMDTSWIGVREPADQLGAKFAHFLRLKRLAMQLQLDFKSVCDAELGESFKQGPSDLILAVWNQCKFRYWHDRPFFDELMDARL